VAAAQYLKMLSKMFDGDWHLVLAAYNGGQGRVQRAMKRAGTEDFWKLSASTKYLPKETREYVPLILGAMIIGRNPAQYGFELAAAEPITYEKVIIDRPIDLRRVAEWTGTSVDEIQALNPELRRWTTPLRDPDYELRVPNGTGQLFREQLTAAAGEELASLKFHTVRKGETITSIARKIRGGVTASEIAEANSLSVRSRLRIGQELLIPRPPAALMATRPERAAPDVVASRPVTGTATVPDAVRASSNGTTTYYRVKRGDTLFGIARLFNTTVAQLKSWNRLRSNTIAAGARLLIRR
jgi:membrane-bound lytic murein transglycosylase D